MEGIVYLHDKAGRALAAAEQRIAQLDAENQVLREQVAADEPAQDKPRPTKEKT